MKRTQLTGSGKEDISLRRFGNTANDVQSDFKMVDKVENIYDDSQNSSKIKDQETTGILRSDSGKNFRLSNTLSSSYQVKIKKRIISGDLICRDQIY